MATYKITFKIVELLTKLRSDAFIETVGFDNMEVTMTVPTDLTTQQIATIKSKCPFVEVAQIE